jgi:class 3 adenylate cyclase
MSPVADDRLVDRARQAVARQSWNEAYDLLSEADRKGELDSEGLVILADAAYVAAHPEVTIEAWERVHGASIQSGDHAGAAHAAAQVATFLLASSRFSQVRGWLLRAERLLEGDPESSLHGVLAMLRAWVALTAGDLGLGVAEARRAVDRATEIGDRPTLALARNAEARALILQGHLEEGLALLDEAAVSVVSGELDHITTAILYCSTVCAWQGLAEYDRSDAWSKEMERWCARNAVGPFNGLCRVHRVEVLRLRGEWEDAEQQALRAREELTPYSRFEVGWPLSELGLIRLRLGDLAAAEDAFLQAHELGWDSQPGLALVRLARGEVDAAASSIQDALDHPSDTPSWEVPPRTELRRAPLLAAQVEIAIAAKDIGRARWAADELGRVAASFGSKALGASAALARGSVETEVGQLELARQSLQEAVSRWQEVGAPYEAARARMVLATVHRLGGSQERASMELRAALSTFERLGAKLDARRATQLLDELRPEGTPAPRGQKVFMFTDIVKSTPLVEAMGDEAWGHLVRWHNGKLSSLVAEHGGEVVRTTGDGFFVTFDGSAEAVRCAIAIQQSLEDHRREHGFSPRVRIGLHQAEATREAADWSGVGIHAAARIGALAGGDEILVSAETVAEVGQAIALTEPRRVSVKGISEPIEVVAVQWRQPGPSGA